MCKCQTFCIHIFSEGNFSEHLENIFAKHKRLSCASLSRTVFLTIQISPAPAYRIWKRVISVFQFLLMVSIYVHTDVHFFGGKKKKIKDPILSCYNTPEFHWNNLHHPSMWTHMHVCSHLRGQISKSTTWNGSYLSASNSRDYLPRFFLCRTRGDHWVHCVWLDEHTRSSQKLD